MLTYITVMFMRKMLSGPWLPLSGLALSLMLGPAAAQTPPPAVASPPPATA